MCKLQQENLLLKGEIALVNNRVKANQVRKNFQEVKNLQEKLKRAIPPSSAKEYVYKHVSLQVLSNTIRKVRQVLFLQEYPSRREFTSKWMQNFVQAMPNKESVYFVHCLCSCGTDVDWQQEMLKDMRWILAEVEQEDERLAYVKQFAELLDYVHCSLNEHVMYNMIKAKNAALQNLAMEKYEKYISIIKPKSLLVSSALLEKDYELVKYLWERDVEVMYFCPNCSPLDARVQLLKKNINLLATAYDSGDRKLMDYFYSFGVKLPLEWEKNRLKHVLNHVDNIKYFTNAFVMTYMHRIALPTMQPEQLDALYTQLLPDCNMFQKFPSFTVAVLSDKTLIDSTILLEHMCKHYKSKIPWDKAKVQQVASIPNSAKGAILIKYQIV